MLGPFEILIEHIDDLVQDCSNSSASLVQDCSNSIADALELLQSCTKPLIESYQCTNVHVGY